ncbi:unnamed protein product [Allacma fusca]|uniref:Uncharacterized protein n=1 Tax=Allacma fusca TaxID=39272 RepID=A0A8J2JF43_9HEXA|nr:unnamed protein product [Allacma fusca]
MSSNDSWSDEDDDTVRSLIAATSTRTGGGYSPNDLTCKFGLSHSISGALGPALPISGDYSAYNTYTEGVHTGSGSSQVRNPAHVISAGLTFLTQFVNMISYYLDLRLPHRLSYSEFSVGCLANRKFNRKVAKLNANIVHLCTSQGVPASYLQPRKTISNLLLLFDSSLVGVCQLGTRGPFEVAIQLARSMEESMEKDLVIYEEDSSESDNEYNDYFPSDWETVHRGSITEEMSQLQYMTRQPSYMQSVDSDSFIRSRTSSSIAGNLVSSVTSFFRGWNT